MNSCGAQYILRDCTCLADPLNFYSNVCGYVSKQNGFMYACDPGCCLGKCENKDAVTRVEARPSAGIDLPPGYGQNVPQSEDSSQLPGATPIDTPTTLLPGGLSLKPQEDAQKYKVWQILLIALIPLAMVLVLACFAT
jgi:hypothetical protein